MQGWLDGKVLLVTGAGGALAAAVLDALHAAGARPVLVDRVPDRIEARAAALGGLALVADFARPDQARDAVARAVAARGRLDGIVHLAGAFAWAPVAGTDDAALDAMLDANLRAVVHGTRAALPHLVAQGDGFIAAIASAQAWRGGAPGVAAYAASKAAMATWLRSLDAELTGTDVRVTVLTPMGTLDTPANRASMPEADPDGWLPLDSLARALCFAAEADPRARFLDLPVHPRRS